MLNHITILLSLAILSTTQTSAPNNEASFPGALRNVTNAFTQANIVPDVLPSFNPIALNDVVFGAASEGIQVFPDELLTMQQTHDPPQYFISSNTSDLFTSNSSWVITIVDPDAPTPQNPNVSQFLHFIGHDFRINASITGPNNSMGLMNTSEALVEYFPPTPPSESNPHRYVILVFSQPANFSTVARSFFNGSVGMDEDSRTLFNLTEFASNTTLCDVVAGNFFLVGPDSDDSSSTMPTSPGTTAGAPASTDSPGGDTSDTERAMTLSMTIVVTALSGVIGISSLI